MVRKPLKYRRLNKQKIKEKAKHDSWERTYSTRQGRWAVLEPWVVSKPEGVLVSFRLEHLFSIEHNKHVISMASDLLILSTPLTALCI